MESRLQRDRPGGEWFSLLSLCSRRAWCWGHRASTGAPLPVCRCEWTGAVSLHGSQSLRVHEHAFVCLWGLRAEATLWALGLRDPGLALQWKAKVEQPLICYLLTDHFLLQNNAQRLGVSQSTHSLTTPVVSVATPSLLSQGLPFSSMPTAYNTGEYVGGLSCEYLALGQGRGQRGDLRRSLGHTPVRGGPLIWERPS